jgi:hypothetical protein
MSRRTRLALSLAEGSNDACDSTQEFVMAKPKKSKKSKKAKKVKLPDLFRVMHDMTKADAFMQCALRSLKQRCAPDDVDQERVALYDEILVLEKSAKMYLKAYDQIDRYELNSGDRHED